MRKIQFISLVALFLLMAGGAVSQQLIPAPKEMSRKSNRQIAVRTVDAKVNPRLNVPEEGYTLEISGSKAVLRAKDARGLIWAQATLTQLKDKEGRVPDVKIRDYPSFPLRGFMHDTGRNFRSVELIEKDLDLFSLYKINVFHWHLTDNPAWRIECHAYPQLNDPQYQRKGRDEGKFYSYDEIRDVIAYAKKRGIMIIPEIDMPGHSEYFNTTFGFSMGTPEGMKVLEKCLNEFFAEIPASDCPYMHIGSDEVHVQDPKGFIKFCEDLVTAHGRTPIVWDPGLPSSDGTVSQIWYASIGSKIAKDSYPKRYIDSYQGYLNASHPVLNTTNYFLHQVCSAEKANEKALGSILCLWNDVRIDDKTLLFRHNGMPNGLLAFAERAWCGGKGIAIEDENLTPSPESPFYPQLLDFEKRLIYHRDHLLYDWDMRWVANAAQTWSVTLPEARGTAQGDMKWEKAYGGVIDLLAFCQRHNVKLLPTMDAWMRTEIYVEKDTTLTAWVGFEAPVRSTRMSDGIGYQGLWEDQGRLFVNNQEIYPPKAWNEPGLYRYFHDTWHQPANEIPYTEEQFCWMREPAVLPMKAGWNEVRLYCPRTYPGNNWLVTFMPVTVDRNGHVTEATGIRYRE